MGGGERVKEAERRLENGSGREKMEGKVGQREGMTGEASREISK